MDTAPRRVTSRIGELGRGQLGGGVHRGAGLAHHDLGHVLAAQGSLDELGGELVGLAAGGAVADGDQLDRCAVTSTAKVVRAPCQSLRGAWG
jgi:hypothetical protein